MRAHYDTKCRKGAASRKADQLVRNALGEGPAAVWSQRPIRQAVHGQLQLEKRMGLAIVELIPTPKDEIAEYTPSCAKDGVALGVRGFGRGDAP